MKIHLVSDLHLEFAPYTNGAPPGTDVVIAAGDIMKGPTGPKLLREIYGDYVPIIYIAGNHEFYGQEYHKNIMEIRKYAEMYNVHFLHRDSEFIEIDGVTFFGDTLWTNYKLYGDVPSAMNAARNMMNDFRLITYQSKGVYRKFIPMDALEMHEKTVERLRNLVPAKPENNKLVIVSHMAPHPKSVHPKYSANIVNPYYASDLTELINEIKPDLWVHGHMHDSFDYTVPWDVDGPLGTRVVCNPRGYVVARTGERENHHFNPELLIDI
jgi:Icc-related predicted phosphoesterase